MSKRITSASHERHGSEWASQNASHKFAQNIKRSYKVTKHHTTTTHTNIHTQYNRKSSTLEDLHTADAQQKKPTPLIGETFRQNQFSGDFLTKHRQSSRLLVTTVTHQRYIMDMFSLWCSARFIGQVLLDGSRNTMQHCSTHLTLRHLCRQPSMI